MFNPIFSLPLLASTLVSLMHKITVYGILVAVTEQMRGTLPLWGKILRNK